MLITYAVALAIPIAGAVALIIDGRKPEPVKVVSIAEQISVVPKVVRTEPILAFDGRWVNFAQYHEAPPVRPVIPPPEPESLRPRPKPAATDICARHKMHKVWHGKKWRCQK